MANTAKSKPAPSLTLEQRIDDLITMTRGTCKYGLRVSTEAEAAEARAILAAKRGKAAAAAKLISVHLATNRRHHAGG